MLSIMIDFQIVDTFITAFLFIKAMVVRITDTLNSLNYQTLMKRLISKD